MKRMKTKWSDKYNPVRESAWMSAGVKKRAQVKKKVQRKEENPHEE